LKETQNTDSTRENTVFYLFIIHQLALKVGTPHVLSWISDTVSLTYPFIDVYTISIFPNNKPCAARNENIII